MKHAETTKKGKIRTAITIILVIILLGCLVYLGILFYMSCQNENIYSDLYEDIIEYEKNVGESENGINGYIKKVGELQQENPDVKGWIKIEDTKINYPLLQGTDNNYYLENSYKKEKSKYGSIFINAKSDIKNENANVIIYGHDMKDGQMFKDLLKYEDKNFYETHQKIRIMTDEIEEYYEIIYVFKSRVFYKDEQNVFRYYNYFSFENENQYNEYIENCKKIQLYDIGKTASYGEKLITLITCEYSNENRKNGNSCKKSIIVNLKFE